MSVYEIVTKKIIDKLQNGVIPWRRPWADNGAAVNWLTQKPYRGINQLLLDKGEYATMKQVNQAGGRVKKGEHGSLVTFWKMLPVQDEQSGEEKEVPLLRYYTVFEINQCEGLTRKAGGDNYNNSPIASAEQIINNFLGKPEIVYKPMQAMYMPFIDKVIVPPLNCYEQPEEFYSTLMHELVHATGHDSRLDRKLIATAGFGSDQYSKEELIAEIGSSFLCAMAGISQPVIDNQAAYIYSWLRRLKADSKLVITAAGAAQKAADYICGSKT